MTIPKKLYSYTLVLFFITLLLRIVLTGYYNNNMGGIETNVVYGIQRLLLGQPLYQDPAAGTYAVMQYTPLYFHLSAAIGKVMGIDALNVQGIYTLCRLLALLFNLLTVIIAALIIRRWNFTMRQSLIFATPILITLTSHYFLRGDSMHLFFFAAAMYAYICYSEKQQLPHIILAAVLSAACVMTKQSGILVCGLISLLLLFSERRYLTAALYTVVAIATAACIAWSCTAGDWPSFYQNAYLGLRNGTDLSFLYNAFISQFFYELIPCYFLGGTVAWLAVKEIKDKTFRILTTGVVLSWVFAMVTGCKIGSSNNYFVEFLFFMVLLLPYLFQSTAGSKVLLSTRSGRTLSIHTFAATTLFILITSKTLGLFTAVYIEKSISNNKEEYQREQRLFSYFINELHLQKGEHILFTERNFLDNVFIEYAIMPTKDVASETYLANSRTYNYSAFTNGLNTGLVKYIVADARNKDLNRWHEQLPFMVIESTEFKKIAEKEAYSVYEWNYNADK